MEQRHLKKENTIIYYLLLYMIWENVDHQPLFCYILPFYLILTLNMSYGMWAWRFLGRINKKGKMAVLCIKPDVFFSASF